jgi:hypothetical protein
MVWIARLQTADIDRDRVALGVRFAALVAVVHVDVPSSCMRYDGAKARAYIHSQYPGNNILEAFDAIFIGLMFGRHVYIEGASGIGNTQIVREPAQCFRYPTSSTMPTQMLRISAYFERGPLLTPGLLGLVIDELSPLPASTSNVC